MSVFLSANNHYGSFPYIFVCTLMKLQGWLTASVNGVIFSGHICLVYLYFGKILSIQNSTGLTRGPDFQMNIQHIYSIYNIFTEDNLTNTQNDKSYRSVLKKLVCLNICVHYQPFFHIQMNKEIIHVMGGGSS